MGQYYSAVIKEGREFTGFNMQVKFDREKDNFEDYNGIKLLEHSWWGNDFCTAFAYRLVNRKARVAWVGDYAEPEELQAIHFPKHSYDLGSNQIKEITDWKLDDIKYFVNHDKKSYIDLQEYKKKSDNNGWIIFPISLMTAVGNGRGGGDYHEDNIHFKDVGTWAGDMIELTNQLPKDYKLLDIYFKEA